MPGGSRLLQGVDKNEHSMQQKLWYDLTCSRICKHSILTNNTTSELWCLMKSFATITGREVPSDLCRISICEVVRISCSEGHKPLAVRPHLGVRGAEIIGAWSWIHRWDSYHRARQGPLNQISNKNPQAA